MEIKVENVSKKFKDNWILKDVNLTLESGKIYGFKGRNGSGKSVLLKIMCDLLPPTTGRVLIDNIDIKNKIHTFNLGALIEKPNFFSNLSGLDNLKLLVELKKIVKENDILKTLEIVNLIDEKDKKYGKYSLGMKQKLGIAQAIMENQDIIFLDEPFNGIEDETVSKIKEYLKEEKKKNKLIIISSHIKEDLEELCDEIFVFQNQFVTSKKEASHEL